MDTMIYNSDIEQFYKYDYIGAPWDPTYNIATNVGNGGLSLRSIKATIDCLKRKDSVVLNSNYKYDKFLPEDVFYAHAMNQFGYKLPDIKTASLFSIESYMFNEECFGSHKLKENNSDLHNKLILKSIHSNSILSSNIYIIGGVSGGGSLKFINDLKEHFPKIIHITSNEIIQMMTFSINDILLIQHLIKDITPHILSEIKKKYECRIIINIHDFYWINDISSPANGYLLNNLKVSSDIINLFKDAELVIHPSKFTYNEYNKYFPSNNFIISPHIDFQELKSPLRIPFAINRIINIGIMHEFIECKGKEQITYLMNRYSSYNGYKIEFKIVGQNIKFYKENEFFDFLGIYNIHCLTILNIYGETYCYGLSKYLKSGLPILYNNIGAMKERIPIKSHFFKVFEKEKDISINNPILEKRFLEMLDFIISNQSHSQKNPIDLSMAIPPVYNNLLKNPENSMYIDKNNPLNLKGYCIYFPQFHSIKENDFNYYKDYNDITNLDLLIKETNIYQETPSFKFLPLQKITDYNLSTNERLIQSQINLISDYNISGFAIYYYWFSVNTISNQNMIMEKVINKFFSDDIVMNGRKVFFIWANESWSKNVAFGNNASASIENFYNESDFIKNIDNLLIYFKHDNYLKIDNKPVFFVHHPWFVPIDKLAIFKTLINKKCLENNFNGCHLVINSMKGMYNNHKHYDHHFNYKESSHIKIMNNQSTIDYTLYVNNILSNRKNNNLKTIAFNFDNRARLYKPNKLKFSTITMNGNENIYLKFMNKLYDSYSNSVDEIDKIILINSWNEWGEQMAIEPSNERGTYFLNLLKRIL
jgi:hypothetical protein